MKDKLHLVTLVFPLLVFIFLTANNQIAGIDSWYWLKMSNAKPLYANIFCLAVWYSIYFLFKLSGNKNWKLLSFFFFINLFSYRFLVFELDDFVFLLTSLIATVFFDFYSASLALTAYLAVHPGLLLPFLQLPYGFVHTEAVLNPLSFMYILPSLYVIYRSNKKYLLFPMFWLLLSPTGKFVSNALPIAIFATLIKLKKVEFNLNTSILLASIFLTFIFFTIVREVSMNKYVESFCSNNVCNLPKEYWQYGHYLAYKGYVVNGGMEYGVCRCYNKECLLLNLTSCR